MTTLYEVTEYEAARPRALVVWTDPWEQEDFDALVRTLVQQEYRVLNHRDEMPTDEYGIRDLLGFLVSTTHLVLPDTWWTSTTAHQVVQVCGWLGTKFIDFEGTVIPTASLRGA